MTPQKSSPIGIFRYNAGNSSSVARALTRLSIPWKFVDSADDFRTIAGLIFPGAGAAKTAMNDLKNRGLVDVLKAFKKPFLGLCLGMQLLFDYSEEGDTDCLGIIQGRVRELPSTVIKPHMGWNKLNDGRSAYFVHSFVCEPRDKRMITGTTQYGGTICAGIRYRNFYGVQWHPEKSARTGDDLLLSFACYANNTCH